VIIVSPVVAIVVTSVGIVAATGVVMAVVTVSALDISVPATRGDHAGTVGPFHGHGPVPIQVVMNVHVLVGDVYIAGLAIRALGDRVAFGRGSRLRSGGYGTP
jgi:hypothetical protein